MPVSLAYCRDQTGALVHLSARALLQHIHTLDACSHTCVLAHTSLETSCSKPLAYRQFPSPCLHTSLTLKDVSVTHCRCIKPNPQSQPGSLDPNYVLEQLRAGGVLEAVRIACAGFPTRKPFRPFAMRYNILLASGRGAYHHLDAETLQVFDHRQQVQSGWCLRILRHSSCDV